ncbi:protein ECERIFERUM 26-like [Rhododendron vialii]|uniref:protein ECERIFERUM 26-like n=1 Tax=Rhododendron vialii TaxID=182163 RepID=UPI00265FD922|nr:protein ECERIFERUM 26-like [Rhododendron vialii]
MVSPKEEETLLYGKKISSVGPGQVTGEHVIHEPTSMDLAMKLHYLKPVYYFRSQAVDGLTTMDIKEAIFTWLNQFYPACGRFRRAESGRAYVKCNDCGARFIEAHCGKSLDEWMEMREEEEEVSIERLLVPSQVIGPELPFSPLVLLQLTKFRCGGVSVGLSWAHVMGDPFSAAEFMNAWGQAMRAQKPALPLKQGRTPTKPETYPSPPAPFKDPLSVKRVGPVGDHWVSPNNCKMGTFSLNLSTKQMNHLQSKVSGQVGSNPIPVFESICALIWKAVAKIRNGPEPKVVTVCRNDSRGQREKGILGNGQVISIVKAEFSVTEAEPKELAEMVINQAEDERSLIREAMEREGGLPDFVVYGANLTFVDLEDADLYGLEFNGQKPIYVGYDMDGIGDEGAVLVIPGPKDATKVVTLIMPESEVFELKSELKRELSIA